MYSPDMIEGLSLGYAVGEVDETINTHGSGNVTGTDESTMFVTYASGPITVGYQTSEADGTTSTQDDDSTAIGISYAVTDDFSISYGEHELDLGSSTSDQESEGSQHHTLWVELLSKLLSTKLQRSRCAEQIEIWK